MISISDINEYVKNPEYRTALGLPAEVIEKYEPLAQGEYNANYVFVHPITGKRLVLRVNCGSQMHLDNQIEYEANALKLTVDSGRTPQVYYVDGSGSAPGNGMLVMEYFPGEALDYNDEDQIAGAAECLADIHSLKVREDCGLIAPKNSLKAILDECEEMLAIYLDSDIPTDAAKMRLRKLLDNTWKLIGSSDDAETYRCCINTELNSTNFLVCEGVVRLIDWEKPLYGDPAQDLGHFLAPTTTFWKTDVIFDQSTIERFVDVYIRMVNDRFDTTGLRDRTRQFITITCLRGMTWCAMAWVQYQSSEAGLRNESTWNKLGQYLSDGFISDIENRINDALNKLS